MASEIESMKDGENFNPQAFGCVVARFLVPSWMLTSKEGGAEQNAGRSSHVSSHRRTHSIQWESG